MSLSQTIKEHLAKRIEQGELSNEELVQIIELIGFYLNIATIASYAQQNKMSYNGVKKCRNIVTLFGTKYVIDND